MADASLKYLTARTIKWNAIDKLSSQVLYGVTGIILANLLSDEDFGLVGAVTIFQAFAALFVDSGFSFALIQRKSPTQADYSSVFWFNMGMSTVMYIILFACAKLIALCFDGDMRLVPLSRVMFLNLIINALSIVQINILTKKMDVRMVAISNTVGMVAGAVVGIWLAFAGYGAWAVVWQTLTLGSVKAAMLWVTGHWCPMAVCSWRILKSYFSVGFGVMGSAWLNTLFQNINGIVIGNRNGMASLGYYTQADKWSKMGVASLSQILNTSFLPALSQYQDSPKDFAALTAKMNRLTAYLALPACIFLAVLATPIFHVLFGDKWDASILLFQLLLVRGIFVIFAAGYNNYLIALGKAKLMIVAETVRDVLTLLAIIVTVPYIALASPGNLMLGVQIFVAGQVAAAFIAWGWMLFMVARVSYSTPWRFILDMLPYAVESVVIAMCASVMSRFIDNAWILLAAQGSVLAAAYIGINGILKSKIQKDVFDYVRKKKAKKQADSTN
ncbi:MAG: lipopolysaccharide biosynthesis protein [Muribaculaceae bacterium]|nr:lipopolysaccharide biosynthesis protein [Muribaculaceae bacterium]